MDYPAPLSSLNVASIQQAKNRADYLAITGQQAPAWDKSRVIQRWWDTAIAAALDAGTMKPGDVVTYQQTTDVAPGTLIPLEVPASEAAVPNFPGYYDYPKYAVAPTSAYLLGPDGTVTPIDPGSLCTAAEARGLAVDVGSKGAPTQTMANFVGYRPVYPSSETRRPWVLTLADGSTVQAALLLAQRNARGVGAPGHWDLTTHPGSPQWVSEIPQDSGERDLRPNRPVGLRPLLPTEVIVGSGTFAGAYVVDLLAKHQAPAAPAAAVDLTPINGKLDGIAADVAATRAMLGRVAIAITGEA